jgi:hypothetical protein
LGIDLSGSSCPIRTTTTWDNGYGPLYVVRFSRKLCQTSSSALRRVRAGSIQDRGGACSVHPRNDPEGTGRWPKTPELLGCRPAGTSLLSLGRTLLRVDYPRPGITQQVCPARCNRACWVTVVHPCREVIYSNSRVHGNRTLSVVSLSTII